MRTRRGAALVTVILSCLILAVMVKALVLLGQRGAFEGRQEVQRASADALVDAGVAHALSVLAEDLTTTADLSGRLNAGNYGLRWGPGHSVNNLLNRTGSVDGPRGPGTVPPRTADLVVTADCGGETRRIEVLVQKRFMPETSYALSASNEVHLAGDVKVRGVKDLAAGEEIPAGIHSNLERANADRVVTWSGSGTERADVSGEVSVVSPSATAIDFPSYVSTRAGARKAPEPPIDIGAEIRANSGRPAAVIDPAGSTTLTAGKSFHSGDLVINGDLNLEDASLYVSGKLVVNGAITGKGSVYVGGTTEFKGDSKVLANNDQGVALLSKGSVELSGFDGSAYLASRVDASLLSETQTYLRELADLVRDPAIIGAMATQGGRTRALMTGLNGARTSGSTRPAAPGREGVLTEMVEQLRNHPSTDASKRFLVKKLTDLNKFFANGGPGLGTCAAWDGGVFAAGAWDQSIVTTGTSTADRELIGRVALQTYESLEQMDLNRLGTAYFQGIIYTNGSLHCSNELNVVGAVWARDDGSQAPANGRNPGDVMLDSGVSLTLVERYATGEAGGQSTAGWPTIMAWMSGR